MEEEGLSIAAVCVDFEAEANFRPRALNSWDARTELLPSDMAIKSASYQGKLGKIRENQGTEIKESKSVRRSDGKRNKWIKEAKPKNKRTMAQKLFEINREGGPKIGIFLVSCKSAVTHAYLSSLIYILVAPSSSSETCIQNKATYFRLHFPVVVACLGSELLSGAFRDCKTRLAPCTLECP